MPRGRAWWPSAGTFAGLYRAGFLDADEHEVVEHPFRRQRDVHDLGEIHLEDRQEQFQAPTTFNKHLLHMQQKVALHFSNQSSKLPPCNPRPRNS
jgi:hypothetical protein